MALTVYSTLSSQVTYDRAFAIARSYSSFNDNVVEGSVVDNAGNIYVTGQILDSCDFDPSGTTVRHKAGAYLAKYDSSGNYLWGFSLKNGRGKSVSLDNSGNVIIAGEYYSHTLDFDPGLGTAYISSKYNAMYVAKYTSAGAYIWAIADTCVYGDDIIVQDLKCDASGNSYVTGYYKGSIDVDPSSGSTIISSAGVNDADMFIIKYSSSGALQWAHDIGGITTSQMDIGHALSIDNANNIYIAGIFSGGVVDFDPSTTATANLNTATGSAFIAKYNSSGAYQWAKNIGGSGNIYPLSSSVDGSGNFYITGYFADTCDFDPSGTTTNLLSPNGISVFFAKYSTAGNIVWANAISNTGSYQMGECIFTDASGNVYLSGQFDWTADFDPSSTGTATLSVGSGTADGFFAKYTPAGNYVWAYKLGASGEDIAKRIMADQYHNVIVCGEYSSSLLDFDPSSTNTVTLPMVGSGSNIYIAKYNDLSIYSGIKEVGNSQAIHFFPNPATDVLNVDLEQSSLIRLYDIAGRIVYEDSKGKGRHIINISDLANGIYLVKMMHDEFESTAVFIKQ